MKTKSFFLIPVLAVFLCGLAGFAYTSTLDEPYDTAVAFVTVGLDQTKLPTEVSSHEILRASESFADIVLGWTLDPSFTDTFNADLGSDGKTSYSSKRQEKSNLIFEVTGPEVTKETASKFVDLLDSRLASYNAVTNAGYVFASETEAVVAGSRSDMRIILGCMLLGGLISAFSLMFWQYARTHRN